MEPILVYGVPAGSSMGLIAAFEWLGQPYRLCRVDMLSEMREPAYLRLNPRGETPVLITSAGKPLTETMAIAGWLAARDTDHRISFAPDSPQQDHMIQMTAFLNTGFTGAFSPLWAAMEMATPDPDYQRHLGRFGAQAVIDRHDRLEQMIGDTEFLVANHPTLADAVLLGVARWLDFHEVAPRSRWPKLNALRERIEAMPAARFARAIETGDRPTGTGAMRGHAALNDVIAKYGTLP